LIQAVSLGFNPSRSFEIDSERLVERLLAIRFIASLRAGSVETPASGVKMSVMYDKQKDAAKIDVMAARINVEAAEVAEIAAERERGARLRINLPDYNAAAGLESDLPHHYREAELADLIKQDVAVIREASHRIQMNAQELASEPVPS